MSKIGRKPIPLSSVKVETKGSVVVLTGPKGTVEHELSDFLSVESSEGSMRVVVKNNGEGDLKRDHKREWGLHRALLANKVRGIDTGFELVLKIIGLGYKAQVSGNKMTLTLGYSHKIDYIISKGVEVATDKSGQTLTLKSTDKFLLGKVADDIKSFRRVEPYKGTGIIIEGEHVRRKAGKAKTAA